ncbi:MAG TPA: 4Fe-4S ferredoxin [Syntrophobacteraceae bacterium]|jgi:Pyruvate/2-oxoacid:ferredoxin oxidoreductase delta subunit|nr:4Fe-4S ferredoxin [Syntrophobacteraceae bacterium]HBD09182.1 4Fe-4S ferredoxin [Syntrophobacteraceae bacterium]HBZ56209.1 4Fe-4S ferredoxin [Syntrophobacteraceae bacterium]
MCQFCHQHGEGKKWYLKAENYAEELLSDINRRQYLVDFIQSAGTSGVVSEPLRKSMQSPSWLRHLTYRFHERRFRRDHFGQVVPLEDVERVLGLANSVIRLPCVCRKSTTGKTDAMYCFGLGLDPNKLLDVREAFLKTFQLGPDANPFERLTPEEALELHRSLERKGLVHTIWTFKTPFIGAICNCDRSDCLAMMAHRFDFRLFFRAEYVARVNAERCTGCRACQQQCQFGAIGHSVTRHQAYIDPLHCHGCGICRAACEYGAIGLIPRAEDELARSLW